MAFSPLGILAVALELFRALLIPVSVLVLAALAVGAYVIIRRQQFRPAPAVRLAATAGVLVALLVVAILPMFSGAAHNQLSGVLDFASLLAAGLGVGVVAGLLLYPFLQLGFRRSAP